MAVAGFTNEELDIQTEQRTLTVKAVAIMTGWSITIYRNRCTQFRTTCPIGRSRRAIYARLGHGLLHIDLVREIPEAMKLRQIPIGDGSGKLTDINNDTRSVGLVFVTAACYHQQAALGIPVDRVLSAALCSACRRLAGANQTQSST